FNLTAPGHMFLSRSAPAQPKGGSRMPSQLWSRLLRLVLPVALAGVALSGASAAASTQNAKPQHGGTLNLVWSVDVNTNWDPVNTQGVPNFEPPGMFAIYDNLFYVDPATLKL